jgi:hypothetical protein
MPLSVGGATSLDQRPSVKESGNQGLQRVNSKPVAEAQSIRVNSSIERACLTDLWRDWSRALSWMASIRSRIT